MREFLVTLGRDLVTTGALAFGYWAFRLEDGRLHSLSLFLWIVFTLLALDMWADRINRGRR